MDLAAAENNDEGAPVTGLSTLTSTSSSSTPARRLRAPSHSAPSPSPGVARGGGAGSGAAGDADADSDKWAMHVHRCRFIGWMPDPINTLAVLPVEHGGNRVAVARAELNRRQIQWSNTHHAPCRHEGRVR